ncbi:hypothetical protein ACIBP4_04515 [Micromonospora maritima]|uniref:Uncharacterized protein n=1 Tax=Micromonospora maritima TaxID=986711 RepID=A0ABW7ZFD9_9ACTN
MGALLDRDDLTSQLAVVRNTLTALELPRGDLVGAATGSTLPP